MSPVIVFRRVMQSLLGNLEVAVPERPIVLAGDIVPCPIKLGAPRMKGD